MNRHIFVAVAVAILMTSCSGYVSPTYVDEVRELAKSQVSKTRSGLAVAIVYDTSGSMSDNVTSGNGGEQAKYIIANKALKKAIDKLSDYAERPMYDGSKRNVKAELVIFEGESPAVAIPMGPFNKNSFYKWLKDYRGPNSNTPLGPAMAIALNDLIQSGMASRHLLVISDGLNNRGPNPEQIIPGVKTAEEVFESPIPTYFVAFDVDAGLFNGLKNQGVSVFGADDEQQLNTQLDYIVEKKILLEKEE